MLSQKLQQKLLQKLSPQQIQLMKLLQIPTIALEQRIKQEIEENPALEENEEDGKAEDSDDNDTDADDKEEFDFSDYIDDDETPYYKYEANNQSADTDEKSIPFASGKSFNEKLRNQLSLRLLSPRQKQIAEVIIGNIDDSGYLDRSVEAMVDDFAFTINMEVSEEEIISILKIIQEFDPPGVGARNLQECLSIQLERKENHNLYIDLALDILNNYFDEFSKKHYKKIIKRTGISEEDLRLAIDEVLKLNPKPGNSLSDTVKTNYYVIPDFIINNNDGELALQVNSKNLPELRLNHTYKEMLKSYSKNKRASTKQQKETVVFIKQKLDSAKWFIEAIKQRQQTLYITMHAIMDFQRDYFLEGDETRLRPMILKDIAEIVHLDISTISRVANSKFVQTPFGTFLLKSFFSESMSTDSGEEVSTREVKKILQDCVDSENKSRPYTDEKLANILKEKGYNIARRTVAKYREQLGIPVARLRKEL